MIVQEDQLEIKSESNVTSDGIIEQSNETSTPNVIANQLSNRANG